MQNTLNSLVEDLKSQEAITGIGLFGSWSRGDAVQSSDIDLLIIDKRDFDYEYTERIEFDNLLIDLNYVPERWLAGRVPPEIDQKIYEADVLYDRTQRLTKITSWMRKTYWTHERVDLRTESYLMDAYTYLSRGTSAQNKGDLESASVYTAVGLEGILKVLIEVNMLPISNTHFIEGLQSSTKKLCMREVFDGYVEISRLTDLDRGEAENMLNIFEETWSEAIHSIKKLDLTLEALHTRVRRSLNYYGKPSFLKGMVARSRALIDDQSFLEVGHYINRTFVDMLENYAWLVLTAESLKFDYTVPLKSLKRVQSSKMFYENAVKAFRLDEIQPENVESTLKSTREIVDRIRKIRKDLIKNYVKPPDQ